jgi:TonB-dependent starch-binding outer membrane protein SusC
MEVKKNKKYYYAFFIILFVSMSSGFVNKANAQGIEISGKVIDNSGMPLPGTSIVIKGNILIGVQTDFDGNYSIEIPNPQSILIFSFLGFVNQEILVDNQRIINVVLQEDSESLDEVVIVGYGTQKKSDVTGAIGQVKGENLTQVVTTNPMDAIQGRVSGVNVTSSSGSPGSASEVMIRGVASFGNNQPLYIIDGVQADSYFIDANNIASIEILKDAASGSIYGTKAANGVILITTKKGKSGKPRVEIESSLSINTPRKTMNLLDSEGYVNVHRQMYENAGESLPNYVQNPPKVNTDWIDETHRNGQLNLMNIRVSGAANSINYSVGGNYADEIGVLIGSKFTKKGINANLGVTKKKLTINTNLNYSETYRENYKFSLRETYFISPLIPVYDDTKPSGYGYRDGDIPDHRNSVGEDNFLEGYTKLKYFLGTVNIAYEIIDNLIVKSNLSYSTLSNYSFRFNQPFQVRDIQEQGREYAFVSEYDNEFKRINQEYTIKYKFEFGKNVFNLLAGYQRISEPYRENYVQAEGFKIERSVDSDGNLIEEKVPANILDPNFKTLDAFSDGTYSGSGTKAEYSLVSQFGRVNYAFDDKYLAQASVRRDGSSKFGKNNKYGIFPSFALGWKITEENFMNNQSLFDFLKLRTSWGQAGNDGALGNYDYVALISQGKSQNNGGYVFGNPQTSYQGSIARDLQNDDLKWETNTSVNFGLDFTSLQNKLKGTINYYKTTTDDLLIIKEVSPSAGINSPIVNVGEFENKGFEFELGYTNNDHEFHYSAFTTFTTINSEVTKLSNNNQVLYGVGLLFGSDHFVNQTKVGYEPGAYFLPVADGIFQNQAEIDAHNVNGDLIQPNAKLGDIRFVDQNGDGIINSEDETYQGTAIPKYEYSLNLTADYKGFDFNIFFYGVGGNKIYNGNDFRMLSMDTGRNYKSETLNAWTPSNTNTNIPRAVLGDPNKNNRASTRFLENGSYLRIKTIQLGYLIPPDLTTKIGADKVRIYMTGQNLFTFTDYSGLDPEVGGSILSRGIDRNLYPQYKSIIFGAQLQF